MTREEAILLSAYTGFLLAPDFSQVHKFCEDILGRPIWTHEFADRDVQKEIREKLRPQIMELVQNISALRPVSRERVERMFPGCPYCDIAKANSNIYNKALWVKEAETRKWTLAGKSLQYCPICGRPLTDEAVQMVMERLEALKDAVD